MRDQKAIKTLKKGLFLVVFGLLGFLGGCGQPKVKAHFPDPPLATEMVFKGSVFKVQEAINKTFKSNPKDIFQSQVEVPPVFTLYWKGDHHPDDIKIFKNPVNENDVYISCNHMPICRSSVYTNWEGTTFEYLSDFQLHIIPQGADETLVKVIAVNPQVIAGKNYVAVQPTTIEENEILFAVKAKLRK